MADRERAVRCPVRGSAPVGIKPEIPNNSRRPPIMPGPQRPAVEATIADMQNPKPDTLYESNGYYYRTDSLGQVCEDFGRVRLGKGAEKFLPARKGLGDRPASLVTRADT